MIYVALAAIAVAGTVGACTASIVRALVRQQARERQLLLDQMMHLAGRTWSPPPALADREPAPARETERNFEQYPDEFNWAAAE